MIRFLQINVGVGRAAQALTQRKAEELGAGIIFISEQNRNGEEADGWYSDTLGRAAIFVAGNVTVQCPGHGERGFRWIEAAGIRHYSCYWPSSSRSSIEEFNGFLGRLEASIRSSQLPVIAAGDFNSKSGSWGSPVEDERGVLLTDLIASMDLIACNQGESPTFVRGNSGTFIDVTFVGSQLVGKVKNWKVLDEESLSLHKYITFDVILEQESQSRQETGNRWSKSLWHPSL